MNLDFSARKWAKRQLTAPQMNLQTKTPAVFPPELQFCLS